MGTSSTHIHIKVRNCAGLTAFVVAFSLLFPAALPAELSSYLTPDAAMRLIAAQRDNPDFVLLDLRTPGEYSKGYIPGAKLIDFYQRDFVERLKSLDRDKTYLLYCRSGNRSGQALSLMDKLGFRHVAHMSGGVVAWQRKGYALVKPKAIHSDLPVD